MGKLFTITAIDHTTAAGYKNWVQEFHDGLTAAGLVQTSDTGQVTISSISSLPGTSSYPNYEIWRFNDTAQSSLPLYLKFEYGTSSTAGSPAIRTTLGTGSNGSGTITGTFFSNQAPSSSDSNSPISSSSAIFPSAFSGGDGYLEIHFKCGARTDASRPTYRLEINRTVTESTWTPNGNAVLVYLQMDYYGYQQLAKTYYLDTASNVWSYGPNNFNVRIVGVPAVAGRGIVESYGYAWNPYVSKMEPVAGMALVPTAMFPNQYGTCSFTFMGSTHTFLILSSYGAFDQFTYPQSNPSVTTFNKLIMWE